MVTATRPMGKPEAVTLDYWLDFEVMGPDFRETPADEDERAVGRVARCTRCGAEGLGVHAYERRRPWDRKTFYECPVCGHTQEI